MSNDPLRIFEPGFSDDTAAHYQQQARTLIDAWRDEWHLEPEPKMDGASSQIYESLVSHVASALAAPASPAALRDEADTDSCSHWREGDSDNCVWCGVDLGPTTEADVAAAPSTLARKAAEEIISVFPEINKHDEWVTLGRVKIDRETETETFKRATTPQLPVKDQIAAIIERCFLR